MKQRPRYWRFPILGKKGKGELRPSPKKDPSPLRSEDVAAAIKKERKMEKRGKEK